MTEEDRKTLRKLRAQAAQEEKERRAVRHQQELEQREKREAECVERLRVLNNRLAATGLSDFFSFGVQPGRWSSVDGMHYEVWVCITSGQSMSGGSEEVANALLDRLEGITRK